MNSLSSITKGKILLVFVFTIVSLLITSCGKDPIPTDEGYPFILPDTVYFPTSSQTEIITIKNSSSASQKYSITSSSTHISISPSTGKILANEQSLITINIEREALMGEATMPILTVTSGEQSKNLTVCIEKKTLLGAHVIDMEYSKATGQIVYLGDDNTLKIYHTSTKTTDAIPLFYIPLCVSVSPDGTKAAVGHDAHVSLVDLTAKEVISTHDVSCQAYDIILCGNGWAHVCPYSGSWSHIHSIDLSDPNSVEVLCSLMTSSRICSRLHPSGKYIYVDTENEIVKFDIQNGAAERLYQKSLSGYKFWFSENGDRIFSSYNKAYKVSELQELDITYNGTIPFSTNTQSGYYDVLWIDQSEAAKNIYLISKTSSSNEFKGTPYVYVYNSDNLTFKSKIKLENYFIKSNGGNYKFSNAQPYYVFSKADGSEIYVVTADGGPSLPHSWAIQTISIN